jgi:T-box
MCSNRNFKALYVFNYILQTVPTIVGTCNCEDLNAVQCYLETKQLWDSFHELGTEMIITKSGRLVNITFGRFTFKANKI